MKKVQCSTCLREVEETAETCPHCGMPRIRHEWRYIVLLFPMGLLIILGLIAYGVLSALTTCTGSH